MQVTPYWAITYAPTAFQPAKPIDQTTQLAQCLGYEDSPGKYQCRPAAGTVGSTAGFDDCWKCPPKVNISCDLYSSLSWPVLLTHCDVNLKFWSMLCFNQ